jgi:hypothetical protein
MILLGTLAQRRLLAVGQETRRRRMLVRLLAYEWNGNTDSGKKDKKFLLSPLVGRRGGGVGCCTSWLA